MHQSQTRKLILNIINFSGTTGIDTEEVCVCMNVNHCWFLLSLHDELKLAWGAKIKMPTNQSVCLGVLYHPPQMEN